MPDPQSMMDQQLNKLNKFLATARDEEKGSYSKQGQLLATNRTPSKYEDYTVKLDDVFSVRFQRGPDMEQAYLCINDGEPDMNDFACVSWGQAKKFIEAHKAAITLAKQSTV